MNDILLDWREHPEDRWAVLHTKKAMHCLFPEKLIGVEGVEKFENPQYYSVMIHKGRLFDWAEIEADILKVWEKE